MGSSTITGPDGNSYTVTHPDDATDEQIIRYVQQQVASGQLQADAPAESEAPAEAPYVPPGPESIDPSLQPEGMSFIEGVGRTMANAPSSVMGVVKSLNPFDIASGVMDIAQGGADFVGRKASEYLLDEEFNPSVEESSVRAMPRAIGEHYLSRYGGVDEALETLMTDPAGMAMDLSPLMLGKANMFRSINPTVKVGRTGEKILGSPAEKLRRSKLESDMKPSTTLSVDEVEGLIDTARKYDIDVSRKGLDKLKREIKTLDTQVDDVVRNAPGRLAVDEVLEPAFDYATKRGQSAARGARSKAKVEDVIFETMEDLERLGLDDLSAPELNRMKRDFYRQVNWKKVGKDDPTNQGLLAVSRGAKEGVEKLVPEVKDLNREWSRLIELGAPLERGLRRTSNRGLRDLEFAPLSIMRQTAEGIGRNMDKPFSLLASEPSRRASELGWLMSQIEDEQEEEPSLRPR